MTIIPHAARPLAIPGIASAVGGLVLLDGPNGVASTWTPEAAAQTGHSLVAAAAIAQRHGATHLRDD